MIPMPWKAARQLFKKLKIQLPYDPAFPLLDIQGLKMVASHTLFLRKVLADYSSV